MLNRKKDYHVSQVNIQAMDATMEPVRIFHRWSGQTIAKGPTILGEAQARLRWRLVHEETHELLGALSEGDLLRIADGIADSIYVLIGAALDYGIPLAEVWSIVCEANYAKIGPFGGTIKDPSGKVMKPQGWKAPDEDIRRILEEAKKEEPRGRSPL